MKKIFVDTFPMNQALLHHQLEQALGDNKIFSVSVEPSSGIIFYVADNVSEEDVQRVIDKHDPTELTEEEKKRKLANERLAWLRDEFSPSKLRGKITTKETEQALLEVVDVLEALKSIIGG